MACHVRILVGQTLPEAGTWKSLLPQILKIYLLKVHLGTSLVVPVVSPSTVGGVVSICGQGASQSKKSKHETEAML